MGVLKKKILASTLMETLVATSIILIVFVVASLILMNTFKSVVQRDTFSVQNRLEVLQYLNAHKKITLPYDETFEAYEIAIETTQEEGIQYTIYQAKKADQKTPLIIREIQ
jgi:ABC-type polysaccharide/polyol phosphate export permease